MKFEYIGESYMECQECFAIVREERKRDHAKWHAGKGPLDPTARPVAWGN